MEYLEQAFNDLWEEDALLVMGKGLGIKRIIAKFLRVYSETPADGVVMCLNVSQGGSSSSCGGSTSSSCGAGTITSNNSSTNTTNTSTSCCATINILNYLYCWK